MIKIIKVVGKTKTFYNKAIEYYLSEINKFLKIDYITIKQSKAKDSLRRLEEDYKKIKSKLLMSDKSNFTILLDSKGKELNTLDFKEIINKTLISKKDIIFIIGSPFGLSDKIREEVDLILSFSMLTIQNELVTVMLFEQIYRAITIIKNIPYHK